MHEAPIGRERQLFEAAFALPEKDRKRFLDDQIPDDPDLKARLLKLLAINESNPEFLQTRADQSAANDVTSDPPPGRPSPEKPGAMIGRYKLLQVLGEGGFGLVYMAEQTTPIRRKVAVKIIKPGMETREVVGRLEAERQALALMDHPNIAKALDAGETDAGRPYFVMELVPGIPITEYCDHWRLTVRERLGLFVPVLRAVHHAHQKGIIHRDIKPTNILVTRRDGEVIPKVIDFGIAKALRGRLTDITVFTQWRQFLGTPAYMSPEQVEGTSDDIDTRSDIYSLGALLYELMTGKLPYSTKDLLAEGVFSIRKHIRNEDPPRPSLAFNSMTIADQTTVAAQRNEPSTRLSKSLTGEIDWIVMKAMEKDRARRYETADAFRTDLARYLDGEPVSAVAPSPIYKAKKFVHKHRMATIAAVIVVFGLALSTLVSSYFAVQSSRSNTEKQLSLYAADIREAQNRIDDGDLAGARKLLALYADSPERGWEWDYLINLLNSQPFERIGAFGFGVSDTALSANGRYLGGTSESGNVGVWDLQEQRLVWKSARNTGLIDPSFSHDSNLFGFGVWGVSSAPESKDVAEIWSFNTNTRRWSSDEFRDVRLAFAPTREIVAIGERRGRICFLDLQSFETLHSISGQDDERPRSFVTRHPAAKVAISRDGKIAYGVNGNAFLEIRDIESLRLIAPKIRLHPDPNHPIQDEIVEAMHLNFNHRGDQLWATYFFSPPIMVDIGAKTAIHPFGDEAEHCHQIRFSENGQWIAGAGYDHTIRVWSTDTFALETTFRGHTGEVGSVEFGSDSQTIYSVEIGNNGQIFKWRMDRHSSPQHLQHYPADSISVRQKPVFSNDESALFVEGAKRRIHQVDLNSGSISQSPYHGRLLGFSEKSFELLTIQESPERAAPETSILRWSPHRDQPLRVTIPIGPDFWDYNYQRLSYNPARDELLYTPSLPHAFHVNASDGEHINTLGPRTFDWLTLARLSPSARRILAIEHPKNGDNSDVYLNIYKRRDASLISDGGTLFSPQPGRPVMDACFSPNERWVAVLTLEPHVYIFDTKTRPFQTRRVGNHLRSLQGVSFSPDNKSVVTIADDKTLRVWSIYNGRQLLSIDLEYFPSALTFSPNGNWLAVTGGDSPWSPNRVQWWPITTSDSVSAHEF